MIDYDYTSKLSDKDKAWLNKFTEEYVNANLDYKNLKNNLHNTQELKKDCTDRNNARNRCILTRAKASGNYIDIEDYKKESKNEKLLEEVSDLDDSGNESYDQGDKSEDL